MSKDTITTLLNKAQSGAAKHKDKLKRNRVNAQRKRLRAAIERLLAALDRAPQLAAHWRAMLTGHTMLGEQQKPPVPNLSEQQLQQWKKYAEREIERDRGLMQAHALRLARILEAELGISKDDDE